MTSLVLLLFWGLLFLCFSVASGFKYPQYGIIRNPVFIQMSAFCKDEIFVLILISKMTEFGTCLFTWFPGKNLIPLATAYIKVLQHTVPVRPQVHQPVLILTPGKTATEMAEKSSFEITREGQRQTCLIQWTGSLVSWQAPPECQVLYFSFHLTPHPQSQGPETPTDATGFSAEAKMRRKES